MEREINSSTDQTKKINRELEDRVNKLYQISNTDIKGESKISDSMKAKVRKQLLVLALVIILVCTLMLVYAMRPLTSLENNDIDTTNSSQSTVDSILPNGDIDIENITIKEIDSLFNIEMVNPLYEDNILNLYSNNLQLVDDMDFSTKMLLVTSSNKFKEVMEQTTELTNYHSGLNSGNLIRLSIEAFDDVTGKILGNSNELQRDDFYYYYKYDDDVIAFKATYEGDSYIFRETPISKSTIVVYKKLVNALKIDDMVYLRYKVIFSKDSTLYLDKDMSRKINDDVLNFENYFNNANGYQFGYQEVIDANNQITYYLKEITRYYTGI